jgi:ubiquinol-cytochrome c reductase iron-sulfur subunit
MTTNDMNPPIDVDEDRRDFLTVATVAVGAVGVAGACWPLIRSMSPTDDVSAQAVVEVDLSDIPPGSTHTVSWLGKPVFITHRTPDEIKAMEESPGGKAPESDSDRVKNSEWLVLIGVCTHLGCIPNRSDDGWLCPCHGSQYDLSGRILRGPAPRNLDVPPYTFTEATKILIG